MTSWQLYWLTRMDYFQTVLGVTAILGVVFLGIFTVISFIEDNEHKSRILIGLFLSIFLGLISCLLPSTKEMAFIIVAPKMANAIQSNEKLTQMPDKVLDLANAWIEELKPKRCGLRTNSPGNTMKPR